MEKNKKHAYLILAHNEFSMLKLLIKSIDDPRNDIFVHIDAKSKDFDAKDFENITRFSALIFVKRIRNYWGGFSNVQAIISIIKEANYKKQYEYYHILSGVDIPLKTQNEIHAFIYSINENKEFVSISASSMQEIYKRKRKLNFSIVQKILFLFKHEESKFGTLYYFNQKYFGYSRTGFWGKIIHILGRISIAIQQLIGVANNKNLPIYHGSAWYSITNNLVSHILKNEAWIEKHFKHCIASDEIFLQTMIKHFNLPVNLFEKKNMRYIDWRRGSPYVFRNEDYDELINSERWFARKFSLSVDKEIIKRLYYRLLPNEVVDSIIT